MDLANELAPSAGLRNALTHEYAEIEDARVHASISLVLNGFRDYVSSVHRWVGERAD